MTVRRGLGLSLAVVLILSTVGVATASAPLVILIPGFAGSGLRVGGVARMDDGGAIVAGSQRDPGETGWQPAVIRLHVDGSIDLGYGAEGISRPRLGAGMSATALAIDSNRGDAWVGAARVGGKSAIVALNGDGDRATRFGHGGIVWRGASGAPVALAWRSERLLVASGGSPCTGCRIGVLNPSTGKPLASGHLTPRQIAGPRCDEGTITSMVLTGPGSAQLAFRGGQHCGQRIVAISLATGRSHTAVRQTRAVPLGAGAGAGAGVTGEDLIAASGPDLCVASSSSASSAFGPFIVGRHVVVSSRAPGGRLIAVVSLGSGACAALIAETHDRATVVVQASIQRRRATLDTVPRSLGALGMFRCHAHLVVLGARRDGHQTAGALVAIPVRRGPEVTASTAVIVPRAAARCH